jgi:peptide/nickel transport system permease protein
MGTDHLGRDTLSRLMEGARYSLFVASAAVTIGMGIGTVVGFAAGVSPSWIDETLMRGIDLMMGFPVILLAVLIMGVFGPGIRNGMIAIGLANIPIFARLTRGSLLSLKEEEFVLAARACGAGTQRIVLAHLLPNLVPILIVQGTLSLGTAILADAGLSYLGLGVRLPHASWGRMLYDARSALLLGFGTWLVIFPGIAIALTILGFNLLGDGLRDRIDPRRARRHLKKTRRGVSSR